MSQLRQRRDLPVRTLNSEAGKAGHGFKNTRRQFHIIGEPSITDVEFEEDAFDVADDSEKSECELPEEVVEKWIHREKGNQLFDNEDKFFLFIHQKTVVVTDYSPRRDTWIVKQVFRSSGFRRKQGLDRYSEVDPEDFKEAKEENL